KSSMDDSALQSRWLKVSADSSQNGIGVMFPDMPDGSYLKLVKMDPTPSTLSFTGWVGVDV
ncbi:MAG: hypothetical protein H6740_26765, partial [Alphaproteobacteria bacterium]|nr:hypothetical protein [Alphaproteobacteria bacterium]